MKPPRVLIADDQPHVLDALELLLKNEGFAPEAVNSPRAVVEAVQDCRFDVLLLDMNYARDTTSGGEGLELLSRIRELDSALPVVLMTAWGSIELAVEAMQSGGRDFVQKPWDNQKLLVSLRRHIEEGRLLREKKQRERASERMLQEMHEARDIQRRLLPVELPHLSGRDIQAFWQPAGEVGGDYFDAIRLSPASAALCIADVAGKGLPAALLMSNMQASVRGFAQNTASPAEMCRQLNRIVLDTCSGRFATLFYAVLDSAAGALRYTNAGHVPPILVRNDGAVLRLSEGGTVLGVFADAPYEEAQVTFETGDRLVLITDGITEAANESGEDFGEDRFIRLLVENRDLPAAELREVLLDALANFTGQGLQDDATLMIVSPA
ncbi:MAG: SpoIIE family protein phosphatase [Acidobacteria bacterium]|nr:SpoIIE family protein phosphatase [Acidobacteriota bacterium]